jgi:hypothetical protein
MIAKFYIVADSDGVCRMTKRPPDLFRSEIAVKMTLQIPDSSFRASTVSVNVDVPEDRVIIPVIEANVEPIDELEAKNER